MENRQRRAVSAAITHSIFRANPSFEIVLTERLSPLERGLLKDLEQDPDLYGVLRPAPGSGLTIKALGCDTALLLLTLCEPAKLPDFVRRQGERSELQIAELVMDGILEVQDGDRFVSGPAAAELLGGADAGAPVRSSLAKLSINALRHAQALELNDPRRLAARLYFFNRLPLSPQWERQLGDAEAILSHIGVGSDNELGDLLQHTWGGLRPASIHDGWIAWARARGRNPVSRSEPVYKLYLSPLVSGLREVFKALLEVLSPGRATGFKIGANVSGVLRPDKLVAYFPQFDDLAAVAEPLAQRLRGVPAHGVPFTAEIAGDGLLSWGIDPPREQGNAFGAEGESWRLWIAHQLAVALIAAKGEPSMSMQPWQFALQRLGLRGIDVENWTPSMTLWKNAGAEA